jgi:hypothetical protein
MALTTDLVVSSVPPEKAGGASGLATTVNDLGISLGVAVIGSIGIAAYRSQISGSLPDGLPPEAAAAAETGIDGAIAAAGQLPGDIGEALTTAAQQAFTSGLNAAGITSAIIAALAALIAADRSAPHPPHRAGPRRRREGARSGVVTHPRPFVSGGRMSPPDTNADTRRRYTETAADPSRDEAAETRRRSPDDHAQNHHRHCPTLTDVAACAALSVPMRRVGGIGPSPPGHEDAMSAQLRRRAAHPVRCAALMRQFSW